MNDSYIFLKLVIDTIPDHICVIDSQGDIVFVNKAWNLFCQDNACLIGETWDDINYLNECDKAAKMGDNLALKAASGIREVINGNEESFYHEYPCNSPEEKRWFMMQVTPLSMDGSNYFVITHQNITKRKLIEEEVFSLSRIDVLTGIPNRRDFDESLEKEWKRCHRLGVPISLAMIDLDYFKLLNDTYGHQAGDECLKSVGRVLKGFAKRPGDICARYGGEEFAVVYGGISLDAAKVLADEILKEIRAQNIPNQKSPTLSTLTVSIGLATIQPSDENTQSDLIKKSDELLYLAKESGRNTVCFKNIP